jgi:hypothetical protein
MKYGEELSLSTFYGSSKPKTTGSASNHWEGKNIPPARQHAVLRQCDCHTKRSEDYIKRTITSHQEKVAAPAKASAMKS